MPLALLGAGNIGQAILGGLLREGGTWQAEQVRATRRSADALVALRQRFPGLHALHDNTEAVRGADVVVLAVKPQQAGGVLEDIAPHLHEDALVVSVLAGLTTGALAEALGQPLAVVRAMPNTPSLVDEGATAIAAGAHAGAEQVAVARQLFEAIGIVEVVDEGLMDAVTGLSGSGPAYVYMVIEALTDAGVKQGLPRPVAARLSTQTVFGAAKLARETGRHPALLRDEVTTPGGTAIAAIAELEARGLRTTLQQAVAAATERSRELSKPA